MLKINDDKVIYSFNASNACVAEAAPGSTVQFVTKDCFSNNIRTESDMPELVPWSSINPATGPLSVIGAEKGDTLVVKIESIEVAAQGAMTVSPGKGAYGKVIEKSETKIIKIRDNKAVFNETLEIPLNPMIGVIGTAPEKEDIRSGTPGRHGGNMDTKLIKQGNTLYLPVFVKGAKLAMGDLHAAMGDGEVSICGVEVPGEVTVTVGLIKGRQEGWPMLETEEAWYVIASGKDLNEAADLAMEAMLKFLESRLPLSKSDIVSLLSIAGNLEISQIVDPLKTVRMSISKYVLEAYKVNKF